jgi:NAD(P)-dependent dehydrogenase (short-subunit alcohol dehydrogenase family)
MAGELTGRTAIVTGGSRGIGLAVAAALADGGASVVLTSRKRQAADAAAATLKSERVAGYAAHAADEQAAAACVEFTLERFGSVDILVNNAGTNPAFGAVLDQDHARFAKTIDTNVWAPIIWTRLAWRAWMAEHGGAVVNVASLGGMTVSPNLGVYHVTKAALIHLTRQLALELAPTVRVNAVAPGIVRTRLSEALWKGDEDNVAGITPLGRIGAPADIAGAVAFLASDRASWITGEALVIDGGQLLNLAQPDAARERAA